MLEKLIEHEAISRMLDSMGCEQPGEESARDILSAFLSGIETPPVMEFLSWATKATAVEAITTRTNDIV